MLQLESCKLCPHACGVNRLLGETGLCGEGPDLRISHAGLHFGEEPPIRGQGGSGTIFISGCAMNCPFCQNHQISQGGMGREVSIQEFTQMCLALQNAGAENINLVTPTHSAAVLAEGIKSARNAGLHIPVAWNSSGFESVETIEALAEFVDIWLPDFKTADSNTAGKYYGLPSYADAAQKAILAMAELTFMEMDARECLRRGLMVRHLVLPGEMESTRAVLEWFARTLKDRAWLSLMTQYTPVKRPNMPECSGIPDRYLHNTESAQLLYWLEELGIDDGYVQDLVPDNSWLPDFSLNNPFGKDLFKPIWRWFNLP